MYVTSLPVASLSVTCMTSLPVMWLPVRWLTFWHLKLETRAIFCGMWDGYGPWSWICRYFRSCDVTSCHVSSHPVIWPGSEVTWPEVTLLIENGGPLPPHARHKETFSSLASLKLTKAKKHVETHWLNYVLGIRLTIFYIPLSTNIMFWIYTKPQTTATFKSY